MAAAAALLTLVPVGTSLTAATWRDSEWDRARTGTAASDCTQSGVYRTAARSRFLSGSIAGTSLDPVVALHGIQVVNPGTGSTVDNGGVALGDDAYRQPVDLSAAGGTVRTQTGLTLPVAPGTAAAGAISQWAQARSTGDSAAASGAITQSGAIDTSASDPTSPTDAVVDVSGALATVSPAPLPGLSAVTLDVGAVAATASARTCAGLWGLTGSALVRDYRVSSLRLGMRDAAIGTLGGALTAQRTAIGTTTTQLGTAGGTAVTAIGSAAASGLNTAVTQAVAPLGLLGVVVTSGTPVVDVSLDPTAEAAVDAALGETLSDSSGLVTVRFDTGRITVDLSVLGGLNGRPANTQLLSTAQVSRIASALTDVVNQHTTHVENAWAASAAAIRVHVRVTSTLAARISLVQTSIATVTLDVTGTAAQFAAGTEPHTQATVTALNGWAGGVSLAAALTPSLLQTTVFTPLESAVGLRVTTPASNAVASATAAANTATGTATATIPVDVQPLATAVSVAVNVQPDVSPLPPAYAGDLPSGARSISAVRVTLGTGAAPALVLSLASAAVGPNGTVVSSP